MWERLIGWFKLLWDAGEKVSKHSEAIDELGDSDRQLLQLVQNLATRVELLRKDNDNLRDELRHERELREASLRELELRQRLQISEELRRLPPSDE